MAYRHFNGALYLQCWYDGSHICMRELGGRMNPYGCVLDVKIQPQATLSYGPDAAWCLHHDDILYAGRNDSTFSGSREADGLLVRYGAWEFPFRRTFDIVGQWCGYSVVLNLDDGRTVYVYDARKRYTLNKVLHQDLVFTLAAGGAVKNINDLPIYTREGWLNVQEAGAWADASELPWGSDPV